MWFSFLLNVATFWLNTTEYVLKRPKRHQRWPENLCLCFCFFVVILGHFWCSVVSSLTFSRTLNNYKKNPKTILKKSKKKGK